MLFALSSGKIKLFITSVLLNFRKKHPDLFQNGNYIPIMSIGPKADKLLLMREVLKIKLL